MFAPGRDVIVEGKLGADGTIAATPGHDELPFQVQA